MASSCCNEIVVTQAVTSVVVVAGGEQGPPGAGLPTGGTVGDFLRKTTTGTNWDSGAELTKISFETYSKNLKSVNYSFNFSTTGDLESIVYANGVTKTFQRDTAGVITSIVLTGTIPAEVTHTTKTFNYNSSGTLTAIAYS